MCACRPLDLSALPREDRCVEASDTRSWPRRAIGRVGIGLVAVVALALAALYYATVTIIVVGIALGAADGLGIVHLGFLDNTGAKHSAVKGSDGLGSGAELG